MSKVGVRFPIDRSIRSSVVERKTMLAKRRGFESHRVRKKSRNREKVSHRAHNPKLAVRLCLPQLIFIHSSNGRAVATPRSVVGSNPTG